MLQSVLSLNKQNEGYVYVSYGHPKYLKHAIASVSTLRRHDKSRPIALACSAKHKEILEQIELSYLFDVIHQLPEEHASIVGFKHNIHHYLFYKKNIFLDSDIVWCKDPQNLWNNFSSFDFAPAAGVLILEVTLLICDVLFLQESSFIFDPFYDNWEKKSMSKYN